MDEIDWLKSRIRVWKTYSMMAWQAKRKAEKELAKEKQRNAELQKKITDSKDWEFYESD